MRPNNQNKRSRGRGSGGRKHSNPLSRNYESNGPDVKIRGNASHIAEKYQQLARDAQASGDSVMAENYLQHAEHYFRILSAAQAQMPQRTEQSAQNTDNSASQDNVADNSGGDSSQDTNRGESRGRNRDDRSQESAAPASDAEAKADDQADEKKVVETASESEEPRKPRTRRPRRKPQTEDAPVVAEASDGEATAELPAFLTGGATTAAE